MVVRVFARANVGGLRAGRWHDVDTAHPELDAWRDALLVTDVDYAGAGPPVELPPPGCCGS